MRETKPAGLTLSRSGLQQLDFLTQAALRPKSLSSEQLVLPLSYTTSRHISRDELAFRSSYPTFSSASFETVKLEN